MASLQEVQKHFLHSGMLTMRIRILDGDANDIEVLFEKVSESAQVFDMEWEEDT